MAVARKAKARPTKAKKRNTKTKKKRNQKRKNTKVKVDPKELKKRQREQAKARQAFIQSLTPSLIVGVILGVIAAVAVDPKMGVVAGAAIPVLSLSLKYPRQAFWGFLMYLPLSGTVTYALGGSVVLQLAKDGIYLPALIGIWRSCRQMRIPFWASNALKPTLLILLTCSVMTLLSVNGMQQLKKPFPDDKSPLALGILGFKVFMGYIPIIFCTYHLIRSKKELLFATRITSVLAIVCCALAYVQYYFLLTGRCAGTDHLEGSGLFKASIDARCFVGGSLVWSPSQNMVRLPGTFVAPWQWAWFLISNAFFTYTTAFNDPSPLWRLIGLGAMGGIFMNAVISGQRIALALVPVVTVILLVLTGQVTNLKRFLPIALGLVLLLGGAAVLFPDVLQERIDSFTSRWAASPADEFIGEQFGFVLKKAQNNPFGAGLGRATNSARVFGRTTLIETWFPKVMWEVGFPGIAAFLAFVTVITITTFKAYRSVKEKNLRGIGASYWVFVLFISYQTYYYPLDVDPVAVYYWYAVGVLLRLPEIDRADRKQRLLEAEDDSEDLEADLTDDLEESANNGNSRRGAAKAAPG
ncbi:hypothetical protein H6G52_06515 [Limnothrix sp. FACHB-881]|uniref:hormogonium polysaccharide biosynthesis protein HpsL n=1 Tax=Limnothrix sp. FACHB-881 TaxID=2692819 RepID=UPI001687EE83|nr:hormogonium polysaccharide biosynthesis protein HpsL [Limnothrix sp. FACHB-881]MBD2635009.1 hypothetical protein [Limnothrix sp. FACHB-881]